MTYNVYMDGELVNTEGPVELEKANDIAIDCNLAKRDNPDIHEVTIEESTE